MYITGLKFSAAQTAAHHRQQYSDSVTHSVTL
jgi:hypothetical protein